MNSYKWVKVIIPITLVLAIAAGFLNEPNADWLLYMKAAILYINNAPLYNIPIKQYSSSAVCFLYTPTFTFLMSPISRLPFLLSSLLWCALKLLLLYRVATIVANKIGYHSLPDNKKALIFLFSYLFSLRFLLYDFGLGQITLFLLWTMIEGWYQVKKGNNITGALLLAAGLFIKTLSLVFIPYLVYKKKFKAIGLLLGWVLILVFLPFLFGRWNYNLAMYKEWLNVINPINTDASIKANISSLTLMHDLHIAVPAWYFSIAPFSHSIFQFNDLTGNQINLILYSLIICFIAGFLFIPGTVLFTDKCDEKTELAELSYILGVIPLIFPLQQKYSYVLLIPLMIYVVYSLISEKANTYLLIIAFISFALMVLSTDGIIGRPLNIVTQQLKFVTIGAIMLLGLLFIIRRNERKVA